MWTGRIRGWRLLLGERRCLDDTTSENVAKMIEGKGSSMADNEPRDVLKDIKERYAYALPVPLPDVKWLLKEYDMALVALQWIAMHPAGQDEPGEANARRGAWEMSEKAREVLRRVYPEVL